MYEKGTNPQAQPVPRQQTRRRLIAGLALVGVVLLSLAGHHRFPVFSRCGSLHHPQHSGLAQKLPKCPAQSAIAPTARPDITKKIQDGAFNSPEFRNLSVSRLAGAVQISTQNFQDMGLLGEDPRWDSFYDLEKYFRKTFPLLHQKLVLDVINEHGLLYTWKGSDQSLKPVLLMSHQDTVPVAADTLSQWVYPPLSGYFDGTYINGRGSHDCKNNVVAILSSITALLEQDFVPARTLVVAFGFDEENGVHGYGAARLARHLVETRGSDAFAIIVDEGVISIGERYGRAFAYPQSSEKGYFDLELTVHLPGGHSSVPPHSTSIGILARAVAALEDAAEANFPLQLHPEHPLYTLLQCAADDPLTNLPNEVRGAIHDPDLLPRVAKWLAKEPTEASALHTTQAVTIFQAGNKANALPAFAKAIVNYRVSTSQTLAQVQAALIDTVRPVADAFGLNFTAGPKPTKINADTQEHIAEIPEFALDLSWNTGLEASPLSSTDSSSWKYFSGVIKHVFDEPGAGNDVIVAPIAAIGNTDTRFYWDLSSQIYRFGPIRQRHDQGWGGIHDVNERVALDAHLEAIMFYHEFIRVFDEAEL